MSMVEVVSELAGSAAAAQQELLSPPALDFLQSGVLHFSQRVEDVHVARRRAKLTYQSSSSRPDFSRAGKRGAWQIDPLPERLKCRHIDMGDVSPANVPHLCVALNSGAQGVQVDFDDGHCPSWSNSVRGLHNVLRVVRGELPGVPALPACPALMLRPRAFNITQHNVLVAGRTVPATLLDLFLLIFHCGPLLCEAACGPWLYLSKVESAGEARLWADMFCWLETRLGWPRGTIKATVLIENILAAFEAEEILYELRHHSLGLNTGIWDYIASMVSKFGHRREFILPDRATYVSGDSTFLQQYLSHVVRTCHSHGAPATAGMAPHVLHAHTPDSTPENQAIIKKVILAKVKEIQAGVDGLLLYDSRLVPYVSQLWKQQCGSTPNQLSVIPSLAVSAEGLLGFPEGGVRLPGLQHSLRVTILFIYHWLGGVGHFFYRGLVEDSATAEISRCQVWQAIRHGVILEDTQDKVSYKLVQQLWLKSQGELEGRVCRSGQERKRLGKAATLALMLVSMRDPPDFITTFLSDLPDFRRLDAQAQHMQSHL